MRTINPELTVRVQREKMNPHPFRSKGRSPLGLSDPPAEDGSVNLAKRMGVSYKDSLLRLIPVPKMMLIVERRRA
jgi:hypothetical protein